ncbi:Transmembrane epididymal protein 1A [Sciurus carolinensis]|uniref:Transmembrane epididymal protein 1A n=1 Tax=Sciurus carolinensis TaxID=30640 RepID=A0AA41TBE3_SCICA|nr:Transmembrane epididymal protein 1A [Sciurus carolinensis]
MGTFIGHVCPGLFLFLYGLYQGIVVSRAVIFNESLLYPLWPSKKKGRWARLWKISCEGLLKIVAGSLLVIYEISCTHGELTLMNRELPPRFMYPKEWQHLTMFTLLIINGFVDVTSNNVLPQRCVALEKGALVLSSYELLLLLVSHVKESSGIELQVHSLLISVVFLLLLVLTAELWTPEMVHLWMMETFLFVIMGSWLMQAGFILYRPVSGYPWEDDDMSDLMFVTTFFCWHVMFDALCLLAIYGFSYFWHRCYLPSLKMTESKEAPYHESSPEPLYRLLQEVEQPEKEDQAPLLAKNSP